MSNAFKKLSYGLFVLTTKVGEFDNGCITNTAMQLTTSPNQICVAINKANYTHDLVLQSKMFNLSIIDQSASFELFKHFGFQSGRNVNKFSAFTDYARALNGITYITKGVNAYISAYVTSTVDLGTHTLFIATVTNDNDLCDLKSATYSYYFENIKPKPQKVDTTLWRCSICGHEEKVENLPDDFICPLCKHSKEDFIKVEI